MSTSFIYRKAFYTLRLLRTALYLIQTRFLKEIKNYQVVLIVVKALCVK